MIFVGFSFEKLPQRLCSCCLKQLGRKQENCEDDLAVGDDVMVAPPDPLAPPPLLNSNPLVANKKQVSPRHSTPPSTHELPHSSHNHLCVVHEEPCSQSQPTMISSLPPSVDAQLNPPLQPSSTDHPVSLQNPIVHTQTTNSEGIVNTNTLPNNSHSTAAAENSNDSSCPIDLSWPYARV